MTTTETTTTPATIDSKAPGVPQNRRSTEKRAKTQAKAQNATKSTAGAKETKSTKPATKQNKKVTVVKVDGRKNPAAFDPELWSVGTDKAPPKKVAETVWRQTITHQSGKGTRGERGSHLCPSGNWVSKCEMVRWAGAAGFSREQAAKLLERCYLPMTAAVLAKYHGIGENAEKADKKAILDSIDTEDQKHLRSLIK